MKTTAAKKSAPRKAASAPKAPAKKKATPAAALRDAATHHDLKVVRDGFTMPQADYDQLKALKAMCLSKGVEVKKSELLRAGVMALAAMPADVLVKTMQALAPVKSGRKKKKP